MKMTKWMKSRYLAFGLFLSVPVLSWAAKVTSIDFKAGSAASEIDVQSDSPLNYSSSENSSDKQIVVDLRNATLTKNASRNLDTSSFDSKVLLVSPYSVDGQPNNSRLVIQLREMQNSTISQKGNLLKISVPNEGTFAKSPDSTSSGSGNSGNAAASGNSSDNTDPEAGPDATNGTGANNGDALSDSTVTSAGPIADVGSISRSGKVVDNGAKPGVSGAPAVSGASGVKDKLSQYIDSQQTRRFTGRPITLKVRNADLSDVFRLIAEASGFNIVLGDNVKGTVTVSMENVPWDQALDTILHTEKLGAERNNNILRIVPLTDLTLEKQQELAAKLASEASAPRVTRVFPISYAKLDDLSAVLLKFSSNSSQGSGASLSSSTNTVIQSDPRTNSIVVRDIQENIERIQKLINILDTQTPQVLIEAKIVEATEGFSKTVGGNFGFGKKSAGSQYVASFNGANPVDGLFSTGGDAQYLNGQAASGISSGVTPGGNFGLSPQLAFLPGNLRLNAILSLSETNNSVRVISSPRTVVLDKETATIVQSTPVLVPALTSTQNGPVQTVTIAQANLSLNVVPTVTNEGSVLMQLNVSNDVPFNLPNSSQQAVANRNMQTRVLVESGSTLVMGGIFTVSNIKSAQGFPFLRDIPIIGALFGQSNDKTDRSELFFFITPRILNLRETGISG